MFLRLVHIRTKLPSDSSCFNLNSKVNSLETEFSVTRLVGFHHSFLDTYGDEFRIVDRALGREPVGSWLPEMPFASSSVSPGSTFAPFPTLSHPSGTPGPAGSRWFASNSKTLALLILSDQVIRSVKQNDTSQLT